MPADASRLIGRLQAAIKAAEGSPAILPDIAFDTIADVQAEAATLAGQEYQVGFDLEQFQRNIASPGRLNVTAPGVGTIGILDVERMGTAADFDRIATTPGDRTNVGLFHEGTGDRHGTWRNIVYPDPDLRDEVARARQAVWGDRTPQWRLLDEGFQGSGAFPATPAHHFIDHGTRSTTILARMRAAAARIFAGI